LLSPEAKESPSATMKRSSTTTSGSASSRPIRDFGYQRAPTRRKRRKQANGAAEATAPDIGPRSDCPRCGRLRPATSAPARFRLRSEQAQGPLACAGDMLVRQMDVTRRVDDGS
jgi:hypothetical protein